MQFIDSHIHLQAYNIKDTPHFIAHLHKNGALKLVCPSVSEQDWTKVANLADKYSQIIYPAFGIHPWYADTCSFAWQDSLREILQKNVNAWVGESGLDRFKNQQYDIQSEVFSEHIKIAKEFSRPLIIHAVKSQQWLENFWDKLKNVRFIMHSFIGDLNFARRVNKFGGYISFSPSVLRYKKADNLLSDIPLDKILVESDGPYQGNAQDIPKIIELIAKTKNIDVLKVSEQLIQNFAEFSNDR